LTGSTKLEFSEPYHSLDITGGTLGEHGANYAYIEGDGGEVLLTGKKYNHSTETVLKENPKITQNKNIAEVKEATLVTASNAQDVLERVYYYYSSNESISFSAVINDQELGNVVNVDTGFKGYKTGNITKLDLKFSRREITAEVTVK
jgi:adenine specific DNA methylase Mod